MFFMNVRIAEKRIICGGARELYPAVKLTDYDVPHHNNAIQCYFNILYLIDYKFYRKVRNEVKNQISFAEIFNQFSEEIMKKCENGKSLKYLSK